MELIKVLCVKKLRYNFISVTRAIVHGFQIKFENKRAVIKKKEPKIILGAELQSKFFFFLMTQMLLSNCVLLHREIHSKYGIKVLKCK